VEADVAWGRNDKTLAGIPGTFGPGGQGVGPGAIDFDNSSVRLGWDGSLRARAGFLVAPTWLVYVAGGLAWQQAHINATCFGSAANASWCAAVRDETFSTTRLGWTIGIGAEAVIWGNWLVRAEYRFADYGNVDHTFFAGSGGDEVYMRESLRTHTASVGLAYKFGAGAAPMADFPVKARLYKAPPAAPTYAWTGLYAGGSLGGRWADTTWNTLAISSPVGLPDPSSTPASFDSATVRVGGYVGHNWQVAPLWVVGAEADVAWGRNNKSQAGIPGTFGPGGQGVGPGAVAFDTSNVRLGWDGSVRGRVGFLVAPTWLVYGTAGFAWQQMDLNASCLGTPVNPSWCTAVRNETSSTTKLGATIGAGVEAMVWNNWLLRAEYRFADYGNFTHAFFPGSNGDEVYMRESLRTHTAILGLAYKFGYAPVVAKY
jgi:outer membrane immunogenic protein